MATKKTKTWALIKLNFQAIHCWPNAPESESYLRSPHRHLFVCEIQIEQHHNDRDIEYYNFKSWLQDQTKILETATLVSSCEDFCDLLAETINANYPNRELIIEVREDGFEGARCEYVCH